MIEKKVRKIRGGGGGGGGGWGLGSGEGRGQSSHVKVELDGADDATHHQPAVHADARAHCNAELSGLCHHRRHHRTESPVRYIVHAPEGAVSDQGLTMNL